MDSRRRPGAALGPVAAVSSFSSTVVDLPEYIVSNFMPSLQPILQRYPFAFRIVGVVLALWYFGPINRLQSLWTRFSSLLVSSINVVSDEDLFDFAVTHLSETRTFRTDTSLNAMSNVPREANRRVMMRESEESNRRAAANNETPKLKYEETQGTQLFVYNKRLFWAVRKDGTGHVLTQSRYKTAETLSISCLGRSTAPIKAFLEDIYRINKDKERSLTVIRRPYTGGYSSRLSWSRITAKPRRALDTVILDAAQKEMVIKDVEEYMDESTSAFYGRHGIPYRRGYVSPPTHVKPSPPVHNTNPNLPPTAPPRPARNRQNLALPCPRQQIQSRCLRPYSPGSEPERLRPHRPPEPTPRSLPPPPRRHRHRRSLQP